jgi:hypothetical protein
LTLQSTAVSADRASLPRVVRPRSSAQTSNPSGGVWQWRIVARQPGRKLLEEIGLDRVRQLDWTRPRRTESCYACCSAIHFSRRRTNLLLEISLFSGIVGISYNSRIILRLLASGGKLTMLFVITTSYRISTYTLIE